MKRLFVIACMAVMFVLAVTAAQAQTCTGSDATLISPPDGSTLQPDPGTGSINFTWCNASADYFVIVESIPGAHDIFFAFTGGAGGGAGQNFLDLGPACNIPSPTNPTTGCILPLGEHIYFTLETVKAKQLLGFHQYNFTAPSPAGTVATTTSVGAASATFSSSLQSVTLTATVTAASAVNQGNVIFQVMDGTTNIGTAETSGAVTTGSASVIYDLPAGTAAKAYTIHATYSGGTNFDPSTGTGTLTVSAPAPSPAATTTTASDKSATLSSADQNVTLTAAVASTSAVNEGTVTFQVVDATANPIGTAVTSATLSNGSAGVVYVLPGNTPANLYTIHANYSGGTNFVASSGTGTLTVNATAPPPAPNTTATTVSNNAVTFSSGIQHVTLSASVSGLDALGKPVPVDQGTVAFQVMDGATKVGAAVPSATLTNGNASVSYALPAGTAAKNTYTIQTTYSGGTNFEASIGNGTLTVNKAQSTTAFTSTAPTSLLEGQTYTATASSTGDGVLTIGVSGSCSIASGVVTMSPVAISGICTVTATAADGNNFVGSSATPQSITVKTAFSFQTSPAPITISAPGGTGSTTLNITSDPGFTDTINFACAGLPAKSSCSFSPPAAGVVTITVKTAAPVVSMLKGAPGLNLWTTGGGIALAGVFLGGIAGNRRRWSMLLGLLVVAFLLTVVGCGSSTSHNTIPGTPLGTSTVTVTGTSGSLTHSTSFTLTVQ
jgi:hypothetical protein